MRGSIAWRLRWRVASPFISMGVALGNEAGSTLRFDDGARVYARKRQRFC
jgi:hypothetical protein